jgi:hypothetical protein
MDIEVSTYLADACVEQFDLTRHPVRERGGTRHAILRCAKQSTYHDRVVPT